MFEANRLIDTLQSADAIVGFFTVVLGAFVGVWLPAFFAMRKFRSQKWWEKRAEKYQEAISALSELKFIRDRDLDNELLRRKVSEKELDSHFKHYKEVELRLERICNEGQFWFSPSSRKILENYVRKLRNMPRHNSYFEYIDEVTFLTATALTEFAVTSRKDLRIH